MRIAILLALLTAACGVPAQPAPTITPTAPVLALPLELADPGAQAAGLWLRAGYDLPHPVVADAGAVRVELVAGLLDWCEPTKSGWGCTTYPMLPGDPTLVAISDTVPDSMLVSVMAHEFGHVLGFEHTADGTVMDPNRNAFAREHPCVDSICLFPAE